MVHKQRQNRTFAKVPVLSLYFALFLRKVFPYKEWYGLFFHDKTPFNHAAKVLVYGHVLFHNIARGGGQYAGFSVLLGFLERDIQKRLEIVVMVFLHGDGIQAFRMQLLAVQCQLAEGLCTP